MQIQNKAISSKKKLNQSETTFRPDKTFIFHGIRFQELMSDFQSEEKETYLTIKPTILNYGSSGDMIFDFSIAMNHDRERIQLLRFFRDMPQGATFAMNSTDYFDPYKNLDFTTDVDESGDILSGNYTISRFEKGKFLLFANKNEWSNQKIDRFIGKYFLQTPQLSKTIFQEIEVTGDSYYAIENRIGYPAESFQSYDFSENDTVEIINTQNNNGIFKVKKLEVDPVTGFEKLYLQSDNQIVTKEDLIGTPVIIKKMIKDEKTTTLPAYVAPEVNQERTIYCSLLDVEVKTENTLFGQKFSVNAGRGWRKRGNIVVGRGNTYKFKFSGSTPTIDISSTPDGTHNKGTGSFLDIRILSGTNGIEGSSIDFTIPDDSPEYLYYYSPELPNMGGRIHVVNECNDIDNIKERRSVTTKTPSGERRNVTTKTPSGY
jgi:hypothetical protein